MADGKFAAYQELTPNTGNISDSITKAEDQAFKFREEKRLIQKQNQERQDILDAKEKVKQEAFQNEVSKGIINKTGINSHDKRIIEVLNGKGGVIDQLVETLKGLEKDPYNTDLIVRRGGLLKSVETINGLTSGMKQNLGVLQKGLADKTLSPYLNKSLMDNLYGIFNNIDYKFDIKPDGTITALNLGKDPNGKMIDVDGDGLPDDISLQNIFDVKTYQRFNSQTWIDTHAKDFGIATSVKEKDGKVLTRIGFDPLKYADLKAKINNTFGTDVKNMTNEGKSLLADDLNITDPTKLTDTEFNSIKDNFAKQVIDKFDNTAKDLTDYQKLSHDETVRKNKQDESIKKDKQKDYNDFATTVAGLKAGDPQSVASFNNRRFGKTGQLYIENAEYTDHTLQFQIVDKSNSKDKADPELISIDMNGADAEGQIVSYLKGNDNTDNALQDLSKGTPTKEFNQNTNMGITKLKKGLINTTINDFSDETEAIKSLKELGIDDFEEAEIGRNFVKGPDGIKYNLSSKDDKEKLKKYVLERLSTTQKGENNSKNKPKEKVSW